MAKARPKMGTRPLAEVDGPHEIGLTCGIFDPEHAKTFGGPLLVFAWAVRRQTKANGQLVKHAWSVDEIAAEIGAPRASVHRWLRKCVDGGYLSTVSTPAGLEIRVAKTRKRRLVSR